MNLNLIDLKLLRKIFFIVILCISSTYAANKKIALTIDDLPFVGDYKNQHLSMIIETLKSQKVPATGFIIAGNVHSENWSVLNQFREAGFSLGNHTFNHTNLNTANVNDYIEEVDVADKILSPVLTEPKFFRYPYLAMGKGNKKRQVLDFLAEKNYHVAPITIDSKDFIFNQLLLSVPESGRRPYLQSLKPAYLNFIWQQTLKAEETNRKSAHTDKPQILLVHANLLNAYTLSDIIDLFKAHHYEFVRLEDALNIHEARVPRYTATEINDSDPYMEWD
ncbi:polysaccharide deacetylase family protein [Legionella impletisoli]|uniref:Polysaccharide deacetylase n=1 Tax=Legionella impletisoli TaxID=343510 RepID=A0A917JM59_9GAMM|nr:polysaccharide deacetylase family protein [Legionella impletisoli]GGI76856.1 polysaccharide deacetylase [Legionella impletisoli]